MRGIMVAILIMATAALARPAEAAAEHYVKLPQMVVRFEGPAPELRLMVATIYLVVATQEDVASARADRARIETALRQALARSSFQDYATGNVARRIKSIGRTALRQASIDYVDDLLVQNVRLM